MSLMLDMEKITIVVLMMDTIINNKEIFMRKLLIGLLTFGTISAQASMLEINGPLDEKLFEAEVNQDKTYFETLGDLYRDGKLPDVAKIANIALGGKMFSER
jgi:hypothetical protein